MAASKSVWCSRDSAKLELGQGGLWLRGLQASLPGVCTGGAGKCRLLVTLGLQRPKSTPSPALSWVSGLKECLGHRVASRKHSSKTKGPTSWKGAVATQPFLPWSLCTYLSALVRNSKCFSLHSNPTPQDMSGLNMAKIPATGSVGCESTGLPGYC